MCFGYLGFGGFSWFGILCLIMGAGVITLLSVLLAAVLKRKKTEN